MKFIPSALSLLATAAVGVVAGPIGVEERGLFATAPSAKIKNGTVIGSSSNGVDSFLGIPFALPPVGNLRLRQPQSYNKNFGTLQATQYAPACIQTSGGINGLPAELIGSLFNNPIYNAISDVSEDCLYLNVQRPSTAKPGDKLPVVVWIYGGGFQFGGTNTYNAQNILQRGIALDAGFVYVSMAYRLSGYGWMPGKEIQQAGASNIGLHDQRLALQWVQENIANFGGDPGHVVIWGESAGSISVFDHLIINGGDNTYKGSPLFHGAVMNSGSIVPTRDINSTKAQGTYDAVVSAAGCSTAKDTLACLRGLSTEAFTAAQNTIPGIFGYESVNLHFLPRPDPTNNFLPQSPEIAGLAGKYVHVPLIIGDQEDEGTLFSLTQSNLSTTNDLIDYFSTVFFPGTPRQSVSNLVTAYPDDPTQGSPFNTGTQNQISPQFKRLAAILGDITFNLIRRALLTQGPQGFNAWSYINSYDYGLPILGTCHGLDLPVMYNASPASSQNAVKPIDYFISFFNYFDPNKLASKTKVSTASVNWPMYQNSTRQLLNFGINATKPMTDDFRTPQFQAILAETGKLRV